MPLLIALLVALSLWPLKNAVVFGRFLGASMSAYSFSREVPGCGLDRQLARVSPVEIAQVEARAERWCGERARDVLLAPRKHDGAAN